MPQELPTRDQMLARARKCLDEAYRALGDAADWLNSTWQPLGSTLTAEQVRLRQNMRQAIAQAKQAINDGKSGKLAD